ncbi:sodium:proton antiporter NhaD [Candidatus Nomurabacteria bacterium]|nr:sodium:proton antiporter NhaD [Candidatus Nomurabacteria bacterium]
MEILVVIIFILGYLAITLEHNIKIDKLVPALVMMALAWAGIGLAHMPVFEIGHHGLEEASIESMLLHHFGKTCEILIFLIGAMTIVEIIDHFDGFSTIKRFIKTSSKSKLLWIVTSLAFILSAIIDNLTATIVLITILGKLIKNREDRMWYVGMVIITANAGGAWSPIGDVTTTMLWMGGKVTTLKLVEHLILPSLVCMVVPTLIASKMKPFRGTFEAPGGEAISHRYSSLMLYLGLGLIVFVPVFKTVTHLPPYIGMMLSLALFTIVAEIISNREFTMAGVTSDIGSHRSPVHSALTKIEMPSLLFFLGILMTVAALESLGLIFKLGQSVEASIGTDFFVIILGFASAIVDNVPLVAASMGMFPALPLDHPDWHLIAFTAGTGGSMLIIGSAAGVVAMGMERIDFFWYLKKIAWLAVVGYICGIVAFYALNAVL